jgi:colanic acid/amylovoran biosynthesis glycosyltransferase
MTIPLKILVFIETFAPPTYTFIYNELDTLSQKNDVMVLTTKRINAQLFPFEKTIEIPFYENNLAYKIRKTLRARDIEWGAKKNSFAKKIKKVAADFQPDVIHCHFGYESWLFLLNFPIGKTPIFLHFHGFDASHKLKSSRYCETLKRIFTRPDVTPIFVSHFMHKNIEKYLQKKIAHWRLLYYGTDCNFFERTILDTPKTPFTFLQISSFAEKKGHEFTVKAFHLFLQKNKNANVRLVFAGEGGLQNEIEKLIQALDIQDYISFVGLVKRQEAKEWMQKSHCFLHHSVTSLSVGDMEGIPNAIMEAMSMQLPVISTYHSGIPELVENNVNGFLVNERDIESYAEAMQKILTWNYLPQNREKVMQNFEKQQHGSLLEQYYLKGFSYKNF